VANDLPIPWGVVLPARPSFVGHGLTPFLLHLGQCCSSFETPNSVYDVTHSARDGGTIHGRVDLVAPLRSRLRRTGRDPLELSTCSLEAL
jgi:hypothetical protein